MDAFEICVPFLSMSNKETMLVDKIYARTREEVNMFIRQHKLRVYDVNVVDVESLSTNASDLDIIDKWLFASNYDGSQYVIYTTESIIASAIDYVGERLAEYSMFGDAITRTEIPIIDIINRLIEKMKHAMILDYLILDPSMLVLYDEVKEHFKTFSNKALDELIDSSYDPVETDGLYDYIFESLHISSYMRCAKPESITIEGYVEYIASWFTDGV